MYFQLGSRAHLNMLKAKGDLLYVTAMNLFLFFVFLVVLFLFGVGLG